MRARSQSSAYWRIGDEPMNVSTSISMPTCCEMSTIAATSPTWVRAAHASLIGSLASRACCAIVVQSSIARRPAPGRPMSMWWMPRSDASSSSRSLSSIVGSTTDGDWMPSRRVSSRNVTFRRGDSDATLSTEFQS